MDIWHKKDAALFEVHVNKRKGNKAKVDKAQAVVDEVGFWLKEADVGRSSIKSATTRSC